MIAPLVLVLRLIVLIALYAFLGFALWIMWKDLRRASAWAGGTNMPELRLAVTATGERPLLRTFWQPEVIVGRGVTCDLPLRDKAVSSRHARLSFHDGQWWVEDLDSKNGTFLNQGRLAVSTAVTNGDEIRCGSAAMVVTLLAEEGSPGGARESEDDQAD